MEPHIQGKKSSFFSWYAEYNYTRQLSTKNAKNMIHLQWAFCWPFLGKSFCENFVDLFLGRPSMNPIPVDLSWRDLPRRFCWPFLEDPPWIFCSPFFGVKVFYNFFALEDNYAQCLMIDHEWNHNPSWFHSTLNDTPHWKTNNQNLVLSLGAPTIMAGHIPPRGMSQSPT